MDAVCADTAELWTAGVIAPLDAGQAELVQLNGKYDSMQTGFQRSDQHVK